jgi:hypothetical protein
MDFEVPAEIIHKLLKAIYLKFASTDSLNDLSKNKCHLYISTSEI